MDKHFPPTYAVHATTTRKTCNPLSSKYVNLPGAFRPRMTPSGLWEYKKRYVNENITKTKCDSLRVPAGGETENAEIASADLVLDKMPFDAGATCNMFKGSLKRNGVSVDVACKAYTNVKMSYKYKRRIGKEVKCMMKLKHPNVLQYVGLNFERSMLITEYLCKEVRLGDGTIEYIHNARQLLDTMEDDVPWTHRLDIVYKTCAGLQYLHDNGIVHCDVKAANIFIGGGSESEFVVKVGDFGQANFDFGQFSLTQTSTFVPTGSACERNKVGTAPYTAPELIELGAKRNFPSDVYSIGMVMVEFTMPERSHPWEGEISSADLIYHHVRQGRRPTIDLSRLNAIEDHRKEDWLKTIEKCLEQDPGKRPYISTVTQVLEKMRAKENHQLAESREASEPVNEGVTVDDIYSKYSPGYCSRECRKHCDHPLRTQRAYRTLSRGPRRMCAKTGWNQRMHLSCSEKRRQHFVQPRLCRQKYKFEGTSGEGNAGTPRAN